VLISFECPLAHQCRRTWHGRERLGPARCPPPVWKSARCPEWAGGWWWPVGPRRSWGRVAGRLGGFSRSGFPLGHPPPVCRTEKSKRRDQSGISLIDFIVLDPDSSGLLSFSKQSSGMLLQMNTPSSWEGKLESLSIFDELFTPSYTVAASQLLSLLLHQWTVLFLIGPKFLHWLSWQAEDYYQPWECMLNLYCVFWIWIQHNAVIKSLG